MKKLFAILISLASLSANSLQTSAVAPNNMAPAPTTPEAWAQSITHWIKTITNVSTLPILPWSNLLDDVLNFTSGRAQYLIVLGIEQPYLTNKIFHANPVFNRNALDQFKDRVKSAIAKIQQEWGANQIAATIQRITKTKQGLDVFIAQLKNAQSQLVSSKNTNIPNAEENMNKCKAFFEKDFKINNVKIDNQDSKIGSRKFFHGPFKVSYSILKDLTYPTLSSNAKAKDLGKAVSQWKENLIRWALFIQKTTNYSAFNAESDKLLSVFNLETGILALTPQIIAYLQRASLALGVVINNYRVNQQLFNQNIAKITQAISR